MLSKAIRALGICAAMALVPTAAQAINCEGYDVACDNSQGEDEACTVCWPGPGNGIDIVCDEMSRFEVRTLLPGCPVATIRPGLSARPTTPPVQIPSAVITLPLPSLTGRN